MPRMSSKGYAPIAARAGTESPINVHFAKIDGHHHPTLTLSRPRPPVPPRYYYTYCIVYRMGRILVKVSCWRGEFWFCYCFAFTKFFDFQMSKENQKSKKFVKVCLLFG